jgi:error-prone DNA polymerase
MEDVVRRCGLSETQAEALATAGAFSCFGLGRREALWAAGALAQANPRLAPGRSVGPAEVGPFGGSRGVNGALNACGGADLVDVSGAIRRFRLQERPVDAGAAPEHGPTPAGAAQSQVLEGVVTGTEAPPLPPLDPVQVNRADLWATGLSPDSYPTELFRPHLEAIGVVPAGKLSSLANGAAVTVGGIVTHRQRPATAKGVVFVNLEDETGLVNVICPMDIWQRYGQVARTSPALLVRGKLEKVEGVINVLAVKIEALPPFGGAGTGALRSRDFR